MNSGHIGGIILGIFVTLILLGATLLALDFHDKEDR